MNFKFIYLFYFSKNSKEGMPLRFMRKGKKDGIKINQVDRLIHPVRLILI